MTIANTIRAQLGHRALFMIGARDLLGLERGLVFRIMRNARKVTHIEVTLDECDTYTLRALRCVRKAGSPQPIRNELAVHGGLTVDQLHAAIEDTTGLRTSL